MEGRKEREGGRKIWKGGREGGREEGRKGKNKEKLINNNKKRGRYGLTEEPP
jgi:hypothetical protein